MQEPEAQDGQYPPDLGIDPLARLLGHFEIQYVSGDLARYHPDIHDHAIQPTVTGHRFDIDLDPGAQPHPGNSADRVQNSLDQP